MTKKWFVSILGAGAVAVSGGAFAQASASAVPAFYVGAELGSSDFGNDDDVGYKVLGGYQFHSNLAAEVAYGFLFDKRDVEVTGLELVAVGMWPIANQLSVIGKLGLVNWEVDSPSSNKDGTDITWAVGLQLDFSRNLGLRAAWQRYETDPGEVDFLNVGMIWKL